MRVLQLIKTGEGATWAYRQIKVLISHGAEVAVCLPKGHMYDKYVADGIKVYEFNFTIHPLKIPGSIKRFKEILEDYKPDIIHSHFFLTTLFARIYRMFNKLKVPLAFQVPGPLHLEHTIFRNTDLLSKKRNDYWIASCNWTKNKYLESGIPKEHVFLSYYGTDLNFVKLHPPGKLRKELGLKDSDFIVAMVAYMYAPKAYLGQKKGIKGHEDFFEAVAKLMKVHNNIKAVVIGGAWNNAFYYEERLKKLGKDLCGDNIFFLGSRQDVPELYADINLVVHPSYSENLGGAAESLLLSVPTIATNVGGFPDIVQDGVTGYLVNPGKPDEIAAAIEKTYADYEKMKAMAAEGMNKVRSVINVDQTGREVYEIYNNILINEKRSL